MRDYRVTVECKRASFIFRIYAESAKQACELAIYSLQEDARFDANNYRAIAQEF